jgi:hypothetical protein
VPRSISHLRASARGKNYVEPKIKAFTEKLFLYQR